MTELLADDDVWRAEEAGINAFPALRNVICGGWLLRFSGGSRRTGNAATPLRWAAVGNDELITTVEADYKRSGLPAIFRLPSFLDPVMDRRLAEFGYTAEGKTCVLQANIESVRVAMPPREAGIETKLQPYPSSEWLASMSRLQDQTPEQSLAYQQIVSSIVLPAAFAEVLVDRNRVALGYAVIHRGLLCYASIVTAAGQRRRGHARRMVAALTKWAQANGASGACLQVEVDNKPALTLYHAIGLSNEIYRYHYRRQPAALM